MDTNQKDWRDRTDPWYDSMVQKWDYVRLVYTGECFDSKHIKNFLKQRMQGEGTDSYADRIRNFDPELLFPMLIGSLSGQISAAEDKIIRISEREGIDGLGNWSDPGSPAGRLWENADGAGLNYPVMWRSFTTKLIYYMTVWVYVDGMETETVNGGVEVVKKYPSIHIIDPQRVIRWGEKDGRKTWAMVSHEEPEGGDRPDSDSVMVEKRTVYGLDGWKRYRKIKKQGAKDEWADDINEDGSPAEGTYQFYETSERRRRVLPIYCVRFPFDQYLAYLLALKSIVLFNKESERDHLVRHGSLITKVDESSPGLYEEHKEQARNGEFVQNYSPDGKLYFAAPPMGPAIENREIIKEKRENFFRSAYQQLNDQAAQVTATQVRQETAAGVGAFLSYISSTIDEAENRALFLISQIYFPNNPEKWGGAYVQRSTDFMPADQDEKDKMIKDMYFGSNPLPATESMLLNVAAMLYERKIGDIDGKERQQLLSAVRLHMDERHGSAREISGDGLNTPAPVFEEL